ncbi:tyrosine-type recombinase/integrase [Methylobacterium nonmethylotrophicum]|uniref:DUF4102 domain-containing protein n=1 Tax=Methylobacterium nonmethylotrophicum TaxID=1141884 RepID=A0A4Z0NWV8_9HYPH|nr:integrase arm-type DNA-binding domain-containing protein [Methylobacterium nonmethylotrophicum]TGE02408.1 DUF4102 domain-containing protein [Methylobacterium nonmethylotrophicum]
MRFTSQSVAALKAPTGKRYVLVFDEATPGFGVKVSEGGSRQWVVQYRDGAGKSRRTTLGRVEVMPLPKARDAARDLLARVRLGDDPRAEKTKAKTKPVETFGELVPRYIAHAEGRLRPRSIEAARQHLNGHFKGLHNKPVTEVKRADVASQLAAITKGSGPQAANRARAVLSAFFAWTVGEGIAEANPVSGSNRPAPAKARERVLSAPELVAVWKACEDDDFGRIVRLLILTGARREEVAAIAWSELDLPAALWALPGARSKNHRAHDVPLSQTALDILANVPHRAGRDLLFGLRANGFSGFSRCKARLDTRSSVTGWTLHDLRRTAATGMAELGVLPHVVEAVLNHVSGHKAGVAGIYNRASYAREKREALDLWAAHVMALIDAP